MPAPPVPSLGRNFSAPVIINYDYSDDALRHLLSFDSDPFNRWEAGQRLAVKLLLQGIADYQDAREVRFPEFLADTFGRVLADGRRIRPSQPKPWHCQPKSTLPSSWR